MKAYMKWIICTALVIIYLIVDRHFFGFRMEVDIMVYILISFIYKKLRKCEKKGK